MMLLDNKFGYSFLKYSFVRKFSSNPIISNSLGIIFFYVFFFLLQEYIFKTHNFEFGGFSTFIQALMFTSFAIIHSFWELKTGKSTKRKAPLYFHCIIAFFSIGGITLSAYSLQYLPFPTWVMFKSSRILSVMFVASIVRKKRYSLLEYLGAIILAFGLITFTLGDVIASPQFNFLGVTLVLCALISDGLCGNYQEIVMHKYQLSNHEMVIYPYGIGGLMLFFYLNTTGEFSDALEFVLSNNAVFYAILLSNIMGYIGLQFILNLVKYSNAVTAVIVTSCRKTITIILSFFIFHKPFQSSYAIGFLLVCSGVIINAIGKTKNSPNFPYSLSTLKEMTV